jgi:hypothetical protein
MLTSADKVILEWSHTVDISSTTYLTPPRPSEISMKNWRAKVKSSFDTPFMIQSHAEIMKKIMGAL